MSHPFLAGQPAIVTGAGQGVGRGIALALAAAGASVTVAGRTQSRLLETVEAIRARGGEAIAVPCQVKDAGDIERCVARTVEAFGGVRILVNNAQDVPGGPLLAVTDEALTAGFESGPLATLRFMRACHPHLKRAGGSIVNLGSGSALQSNTSGFGGYACVKEGIRALTRAAACEWGRDGIRVNVILPLADSPSYEGWAEANPKFVAGMMSQLPLGRIGDCETDIGRVVAWLCGPDAAYLTGLTLPIDGGQAFVR
jgi:meso-butanediol dehydrogenase / (S,S)-butanediol dehydrogenase / diacetyl reductase